MKRIVAAATLSLLASACADVGGVMRPTISGGIDLTDAAGTRRWSPDRCVSGDVAYFAGFDFQSTRDAAKLRAALDPIDGPVVRWSGAGGMKPLVLWPGDCRVLDLDVQPTAWHVNDVREFAGHVELHCGARGLRVDGRIDVDHCH